MREDVVRGEYFKIVHAFRDFVKLIKAFPDVHLESKVGFVSTTQISYCLNSIIVFSNSFEISIALILVRFDSLRNYFFKLI